MRPLYGKGLDCYNLTHNFELCCAEAENLKFLSTEKMIFRNETYLIQLIMKVYCNREHLNNCQPTDQESLHVRGCPRLFSLCKQFAAFE